MPRKKRNTIIVNIEYYALLIMIKLIQLLSLKKAYKLGSILSEIFFLFDLKHKKRALSHILHAGVAKNKKEALGLVKKNFQHFGKLATEIVKINSMVTPETVEEHIKLAGSEKAIKMFFDKENPQPAIIVTAHFGNWELAGKGYTILSGQHLTTVMRPFDNYKVGEYIYKQREGYNHKLCPKKGALKRLLGALRKKESVCIIADQHAGRNEGVETIFFGQPARSHASPAMLHLKTGVPILVSVSKRIDDDFHFEFTSKDPIIYTPTDDKEGDIQKITQMYTDAIEELIKEDPTQWMWSHRRWLNINRKKSAYKQVQTQQAVAE